MRSGVRSRTGSAVVVDADRPRVARHPDPARRLVVRDADRVVAGVDRLQRLHVRRAELRHRAALVVHDVERAPVGREREAARRASRRDLRANRARPEIELAPRVPRRSGRRRCSGRRGGTPRRSVRRRRGSGTSSSASGRRGRARCRPSRRRTPRSPSGETAIPRGYAPMETRFTSRPFFVRDDAQIPRAPVRDEHVLVVRRHRDDLRHRADPVRLVDLQALHVDAVDEAVVIAGRGRAAVASLRTERLRRTSSSSRRTRSGRPARTRPRPARRGSSPDSSGSRARRRLTASEIVFTSRSVRASYTVTECRYIMFCAIT